MTQPYRVVTRPTPLGNAEAVQQNPGDVWAIGYPWADERFVGSVQEVTRRMIHAIEAHRSEED